MGDMNRNISQNRIAILAVSQYVKNRNNIESWPKYRNTIESGGDSDGCPWGGCYPPTHTNLNMLSLYTHTHTHTQTHTHTHMRIHTNANTHTHTHTHALCSFNEGLGPLSTDSRCHTPLPSDA